MEVSENPVRDNDGKVVSVEGVAHDITERKRAEERLKESEKRTRAWLENSPTCMKIVGIDYNLQYMSRAGIDALKIDDVSELYGKPYPFYFYPESFKNTMSKNLQKAMETGEVITQEAPVVDIEGDELWFHSTIVPVNDDEGRVEYIIIVSVDTTDRKRAEQSREHLLKILQFKNKELQDIVYTASHDLRSPLVNIEGFSGELKTGCDQLVKLLADQSAGVDKSWQIEPLIKEDIPQCLRFITSGAKKMSSLLDGLLQISRIGTVKIHSESLDIDRIVREVVDAMEHQKKVSNITVTVDSLPGCIGDTHMMDHVFTNLISNAIKYRDPEKEGIIRISGKVESGMSIYCVEDNGVGIAANHQKKVFEIFHRLNPEEDVKGEGLGLTIITRIMDRLNGKIWVESEAGKGSKFFIALPTA
jgi:PAS domain S-box-containing protein